MGNSTHFPTHAPVRLFESGTKALKGRCWIRGHRALNALPANGTGVCDVGVIRPLFFSLPEDGGGHSGVKPYDDLTRSKRSINTGLTTGSSQKWGKDGCPPPSESSNVTGQPPGTPMGGLAVLEDLFIT